MFVRQFQAPPPRINFKPPREWLPRLRALLATYPQDDLASTEALCCRIVGDFAAGIVLHRLLYWQPRGIRPDDAIWKSDREWYAELNLSYAQMQRVRARLAPVVKSWVERAQGAPTYHYQLRIEALVQGIATVLNCSALQVKLTLLEKVENGFSGESRNDFRESRKSLTNQHHVDERSKFFHPYLEKFVGFTPALAAKLADQLLRLGEIQTREVLSRCETSGGKTWQYVLRALENATGPAKSPIPLFDKPKPQRQQLDAEIDVTDEMRQAWERSAEGQAWAARLAEARAPKPASLPTVTDKREMDWNVTYTQLQIQLDRASFDTWLREARFLNYADGLYTIGVPNTYARDMLQHRLYRDVRRVLRDVAGEEVELRFEIHKPAPRMESDLPAFTWLSLRDEAEAAEEAFYHKLFRA